MSSQLYVECMSDLNDARTESEAQKRIAQAALAEQLGSLADYLSTEFGEDVTARAEGQSVVISFGDRGVLTMRKGADLDSTGLDEADLNRINLDERAQSELDAIYRLIEQLDAIEISSRESGEDRSRRP